jgi:hypothetical protein
MADEGRSVEDVEPLQVLPAESSLGGDTTSDKVSYVCLE